MTQQSLRVWMVDPANLTPFYCLTLAEALAQGGDSVKFLTSPFRYDKSLEAPPAVDIDYHYFRRMRWLQDSLTGPFRRVCQAASYPVDHWQLTRRALREKPDVVHIQWSRLPLFDEWLVKRIRSRGVPVVHTVHDVEPLFDGGGVSRLERVYSRADALIVHTQSNRDQLLQRYSSVNPKNVQVIPHGPLQGDCIPQGATKEQARKALGIPLHAPVALYFGGIRPYKGLDLLVNAMPAVKQCFDDSWLIIAGRPTEASDIPDLTPVENADVSKLVELDFIPNQCVWQYYLAADVVVLPYRQITQSGVLLSAMAHARPAIVTNVGGLPEVIDEQTGWVVPSGDKDALAKAIIDAFSDLERTRAKGEAAKQSVESRFSWQAIANQTHELYQKLIASDR